MRKLPWAVLGLVILGTAGNFAATGCGSEDSTPDETDSGAGEGGNNDGAGNDTGATDSGASFIDAIVYGARGDSAACKPDGDNCAKSTECCSTNCNATTGKCEKPLTLCKPPAATCVSGNECCTFSCVGGKCSSTLCVADNGACGLDTDCCGGKCAPDGLGGGKCTPLNGGGPATGGNPCNVDADCASHFCNNGICTNPSFCVQPDDVCSTDIECCSGNCTKAVGATLGQCKPTAASGAGAGGCAQDGVVCTPGAPPGACGGNCCTRSCAPYGVAGKNVCQPESGCKIEGNTCRADSDCCGWSGGPQPADKFYVCVKDVSTQEFGICGKGGSCHEPGSLCGKALEKDGVTVGVCNAANNCCELQIPGLSNSLCNSQPEKCCRRDALGIPRCVIRKDLDCTAAPPPAGTVCASSADCCGKPCVGGVCGDKCVDKGGACSNTSDCCPGLPCAIPPGSTIGVCGGTVLPDGGVDPDGGTGTQDAGTVDGGLCALYGQQCAIAADCCNNVPCTGGTCRFP